MKRPKSHQIDTQAQRILLSKLPSSWVSREQSPDYGIDYEIQVFNNDKPAGIWFRIQLKGKENCRETEDSIAISFETDTIEYYLSKVPFPVFLFVVLVQKEEIYWLFFQKYANEILKVENPEWMKQDSVTIRIPKTKTGHYGMVGEMLALQTAGSKFLFCKYCGGFYGLSLDSLYEDLRKQCENCRNNDPLPTDWKWSYAWQQEKDKNRNKEFQKFINTVNRN